MADDEPLGIVELEGNLADAEKPPEVPPGKYIGEVQNVQANSSQAGNRYWSIRFVIPQEELPQNVAEHYEDGAALYWNRQIVPRDNRDRRTIFALKQLYSALGLDPNITSVDPNDWMGCQALLTVRHGQYLGETRAEIQSLAPTERAPMREPEPEPEVAQAASPSRGRRRQ
jgi:hypothetical protein